MRPPRRRRPRSRVRQDVFASWVLRGCMRWPRRHRGGAYRLCATNPPIGDGVPGRDARMHGLENDEGTRDAAPGPGPRQTLRVPTLPTYRGATSAIATGDDHELVATVLAPAALVVLLTDRPSPRRCSRCRCEPRRCRGRSRYFRAACARRMPSAMLYSSEPRSSALPSMRMRTSDSRAAPESSRRESRADRRAAPSDRSRSRPWRARASRARSTAASESRMMPLRSGGGGSARAAAARAHGAAAALPRRARRRRRRRRRLASCRAGSSARRESRRSSSAQPRVFTPTTGGKPNVAAVGILDVLERVRRSAARRGRRA